RRDPDTFAEQSRLPNPRFSRERQDTWALHAARDPRRELAKDHRTTGERCLPEGQRAATLRQFENPSPKRASSPDRFLVGPPFHPILVEDSERLSAAAGYGQRLRERECRLPAQWIQMEAGAGERHDLRVIAARPSLRDRREQ